VSKPSPSHIIEDALLVLFVSILDKGMSFPVACKHELSVLLSTQAISGLAPVYQVFSRYLMQGPTISPVYTYDSASGKACHNFYAITIIVPKPRLYDAVQQLRAVSIATLANCADIS
jgi:hypothetical protein